MGVYEMDDDDYAKVYASKSKWFKFSDFVDSEKARELGIENKPDDRAIKNIVTLMAFLDLGRLLEVVDEVVGALRIDVVAAEIDLREAAALFLRHAVPELAALHVEDDLVAEVGTADAERDDDVDVVLDVVGELL